MKKNLPKTNQTTMTSINMLKFILLQATLTGHLVKIQMPLTLHLLNFLVFWEVLSQDRTL